MIVDRAELICGLKLLVKNKAVGPARLKLDKNCCMAELSSFVLASGKPYVMYVGVRASESMVEDSGSIDNVKAFIVALSRSPEKYADIRFYATEFIAV
jgi:hypothetical protein